MIRSREASSRLARIALLTPAVWITTNPPIVVLRLMPWLGSTLST